jgi:hypothetical protein
MAKATKEKKAGAASRRKRGSSASATRTKNSGAGKKAQTPGRKTSADMEATPAGEATQLAKEAPAPVDAAANAAFAGQAAMAGTRAAGRALALVAAQAKGPLAATGGLTAGIAGGLAVMKRRRRRRRPKSFDLASAAERVGTLGEEVGRVAIVIQRAADGSKSSR